MKKIVLLLLLSFTAFVSAKPYWEIAEEAEENIFAWQKKYQKGDVEAAFKLGLVEYYAEEEGSRQKSYNKIMEAAMKGHAEAQYFMGIDYDDDYYTALPWFLMSAENKNADAAYKIYYLARAGHISQISDDVAFKYLNVAAKLGEPVALMQLGVEYSRGKMVELDYKKALKYYDKASKAGEPKGYYWKGIAYLRGEGVDKSPEKAFHYVKLGADGGNAAAQTDLGIFYEEGDGVKKNYAKAIEYYQKAADQGYAKGQRLLGYAYYEDKMVDRDYQKAKYWFLKAAEKGDSYAKKGLKKLSDTYLCMPQSDDKEQTYSVCVEKLMFKHHVYRLVKDEQTVIADIDDKVNVGIAKHIDGTDYTLQCKEKLEKTDSPPPLDMVEVGRSCSATANGKEVLAVEFQW